MLCKEFETLLSVWQELVVLTSSHTKMPYGVLQLLKCLGIERM